MMKTLAYVALLLIATTACQPQQFAFEQSSAGACSDGCVDPGTGNLHYDYFETVPNERRVDILVISDNSGSMEIEQGKMAQQFPSFITGLAGLEWRIGITTTDVSNRGERGDLLTFEGTNLKYIDNATPNAQSLFENTVQIPYEGDGDERGIWAASLNVEKNPENWIRPNSHLAVIILSDEDENSDGTNLQSRDMPANFVPTVRRELGAGRTVSVHSIVTRPGDAACLAGDGAEYGNVYADLTKLTGGILGNICSANYSAEVGNIASNIVSNVDSFGLKCDPLSGVTVELSPAPATAVNHTVNSSRVYFDQALAPGTQVRLIYDCKAP